MISQLVAAFARITTAIVALRTQVLDLAGVNFSDTMPSAAAYRWWMPPTGELHMSDGASWAVVPSRRGPPGPSIEVQTSATHIQWRVLGDAAWTNLIALSALEGADGPPVELQVGATHIQWRVLGAPAWIDLVPLASLAGPPGTPGDGAWSERRLIAAQTLANDTTMRDWFATAGGLTLDANSTYEFDATFFSLNGATSHGLNMQFAAIAGGSIQWNAQGAKVVAGTQATAVRALATDTFATSRNVTTASTVAGNMVRVWGTVRTGAGGGVLRPQVAQTAASGSFTVQAGTYFKARRVGTDALVNTGGWA